MKESRQHPRVSIAVDVDVTSGSNFYAGQTRDLSLGGLFVETEVALPIGIEIEVKLRLPKGTFLLRCEVVWQLSDRDRNVGLGLRFIDLPKETKRAIEAFMSIRNPVPFETPELEDDVPASGPPPLPKTQAAPARPKPVPPRPAKSS
jgi:uncharacterized protein (TIGR02266 family)